MNTKNIISHVASLIAAALLIQTLYFKFTAHPQSVELFTEVGKAIGWAGANPYMRVGTGVMELIASIMILLPATRFLGALFSTGVISGAIATHLFIIGIKFDGDYGLFAFAVVVFICSLIVLMLEKEAGKKLWDKFIAKK